VASTEQLVESVAWPAADVIEPEPVPLLTWILPEPEPEPILVEAGVEPEPEPILVEADAEPEPMVAEPEPEPEPVQFGTWLQPDVEPEPEPTLVEAGVEPEAAVEPEPEPYRPLRYPRPVPVSDEEVAAAAALAAEVAAAAEIDAETLAARRAQLDLLGLGDPGQGPVGPARPVVLPYRSGGATTRDGARLAAVAAAAGGAFWDASAREVAGAITEIGVRSCGHCELSLSATARFCRRCGSPQSQSA
jgi:hypothetical protein